MITHIIDRVLGTVPKGSKRSSKWPKVRREFLKKHPKCALCDGTKKLTVHHIVPFHIDPSRELDPTNLETLCNHKGMGVSCHLYMGHLGNFRRYNENLVIDVAYWNSRIRPKDEDES